MLTSTTAGVRVLWAAGLIAAASAVSLAGQGLDPKALYQPLQERWATYAGDYTSRRFSTLKQIDTSNVGRLALRWTTRIAPGMPVGGFGGFGGPSGPATVIGGYGTGELNQSSGRSARIVGSVLAVDGILYASTLDNAWAIDARDGRQLWHYVWKTQGGTHTGNRGLGMWRDRLFMATPDNFLVALDARTGKEIWNKKIAELSQRSFTTTAPFVIDNHVLVSPGNDLDNPGFLKSFDAETGEVQWTWYATPQNPGDPGLDSWASLEAARHGGGHMWIPDRSIPRPASTSSAPPIRLPPTRRSCAVRGTTSTPARSSGSTSIPGSWPGTSRPPRTTRTTGTRPRRLC